MMQYKLKRQFQINIYLFQMMIQARTRLFVITFFAYLIAYSSRSVWSFTKNHQQIYLKLSKSDFAHTDVIFMVCLSLGFTILGPLGQRIGKKIFLIIGYLLCNFSFLIHPLIYHYGGTKSVAVMMICMGINGFGQSVGLPGSLSLLSLHYDKKERGFIASLWVMCTNLGKIFGLISATIIVETLNRTWQTAYYFISALSFFVIIILFVFLKQQDQELEDIDRQQDQIQATEQSMQAQVTYFSAFCLPRVIQYCICHSCIKGATFSLLFWLPKYLQQIGMAEQSGYISAVLQVGCMVGGMILGRLGDKYIISFFLTPSLFISTLILLILRFLLNSNIIPYFFIMFFLGLFLGGVNNVLISTICIELGTQKSIRGNKKAISLVTGVLDGVAALYTAATQLILGYSPSDSIFLIMAIYSLIGGFALCPIMYRDIKFYMKRENGKQIGENQQNKQHNKQLSV